MNPPCTGIGVCGFGTVAAAGVGRAVDGVVGPVVPVGRLVAGAEGFTCAPGGDVGLGCTCGCPCVGAAAGAVMLYRAGCACCAAQLANSSGDTTNALNRMFACEIPQYSAQNPLKAFSVVESAVNQM